MSEGTWPAFALIVLGNRNLRKGKKKSYVLSPATSLSIAAQHSPPTLSRTGLGNGEKRLGFEGWFFKNKTKPNNNTLCSKDISELLKGKLDVAFTSVVKTVFARSFL